MAATVPSGLQQILTERFPDGASKEEIATFLSQMASARARARVCVSVSV
jgi:hypothetical protein